VDQCCISASVLLESLPSDAVFHGSKDPIQAQLNEALFDNSIFLCPFALTVAVYAQVSIEI